jgi:hypothetical protein
LEKGTKWKTLSDVDLVAVASVDDRDNPENIEVYLFPAADVRKRFNAAYKARTKEGLKVKDKFGMWLKLDKRDRDTSRSVGTGVLNRRCRRVQNIGYSVAAFIGNFAVPEFTPLTMVIICADNLPTLVMHCCAS